MSDMTISVPHCEKHPVHEGVCHDCHVELLQAYVETQLCRGLVADDGSPIVLPALDHQWIAWCKEAIAFVAEEGEVPTLHRRIIAMGKRMYGDRHEEGEVPTLHRRIIAMGKRMYGDRHGLAPDIPWADQRQHERN